MALGDFFPIGEELYNEIQKEIGFEATLINPRYASGLDTALLEELKKEHNFIITLEDSILDGGYGQKIASFYGNTDVKVLNYGFEKEYLDGYIAGEVLERYGITSSNICKKIKELL